MKNEFLVLILFNFLCLTSCNTDHDTSLTDLHSITDEISLKDSVPGEMSFSLFHPSLKDSVKYYFFIENEAGVIDYQKYDFTQKTWLPVSALFQESFMGGPLHTGRIIHQRQLWQDSVGHLLFAKNVQQGKTIEIQPLAQIMINDDISNSIFIWVPVESEYRLSDCSHFDDWFTYCNQQRFYLQYWIEQQFARRYINRIQWKPFTIKKE